MSEVLPWGWRFWFGRKPECAIKPLGSTPSHLTDCFWPHVHMFRVEPCRPGWKWQNQILNETQNTQLYKQIHIMLGFTIFLIWTFSRRISRNREIHLRPKFIPRPKLFNRWKSFWLLAGAPLIPGPPNWGVFELLADFGRSGGWTRWNMRCCTCVVRINWVEFVLIWLSLWLEPNWWFGTVSMVDRRDWLALFVELIERSWDN